ncbi:MAG: type III pantothenate kinase [Flavonifractor plautii]
MLLTIDIGNTTVAVGGFLGPELRFVRRLPSDRNMDAAVCAARMRTLLAEEGAAPQDVEGAVLSSVVPSLTQVAVQAAEALTRRPVRVLGRDRPRPAHRRL